MALLTVDRETPLIPPGEHPVTVKLSKGAGTPNGWPDVLGLALRIHRPDDGVLCDLLFSSAGDGVVSRWLPLPASDWGGQTRYGTLAPYEADGRWWWLRLTPSGPVGHASLAKLDQRAPNGFTLQLSAATAVWLEVGRLILQERKEDHGLIFDPVLNHPYDAHPAPAWLRDLRERAYSGSRLGRHAPPPNEGSNGL